MKTEENTIKYLISIIIFIVIIFFIFYGFLNLLSWSVDKFVNLAFDNVLRHTRNMSYDLRGDPLIIPRRRMVWNNPNRIPIYNSGI